MLKPSVYLSVSFLVIFWCFSSLASLRVVQESQEGVELELSTQKPEIQPKRIGGKSYSQVVVADMKNQLPEGYPEVPSSLELIWIPQGKSPVLSYETLNYQTIPLPSELSYQSTTQNHCGERKAIRKNLQAYRKSFGTIPAKIEEIGYVASDRLMRIRFWPIRYKAAQNQLSFTPQIRIKIRFLEDKTGGKRPVTHAKNSIASYLVANKKSISLPKLLNSGNVDLIVSHPKYQNNLSRLLDFKRSLGREVREYYVENKTSREIREILQHEYSLPSPPSSTLLVGNIDEIPAWKGSGDNRWTDFPYSTLDGDNLPDISLGRIPVHSPEELHAFIDKAISREKDINPREEILLTAGRDQSLGCPANVTKVGSKILKGAPEVTIIQKYKTKVSTEEVFSAYNQNPSLVVYDGHGNRSGMTEIPLLISSLNKLTNSTYPLILDIACLNANWGESASPRNFAESILFSEKRGAAGILASGGSGYGHDFFQTLGELVGEAQQVTPEDPKMNQIGQVILAAKVKHGTQDRTYWNYYGDPSSSIWKF